jgi:hypothetical protein
VRTKAADKLQELRDFERILEGCDRRKHWHSMVKAKALMKSEGEVDPLRNGSVSSDFLSQKAGSNRDRQQAARADGKSKQRLKCCVGH